MDRAITVNEKLARTLITAGLQAGAANLGWLAGARKSLPRLTDDECKFIGESYPFHADVIRQLFPLAQQNENRGEKNDYNWEWQMNKVIASSVSIKVGGRTIPSCGYSVSDDGIIRFNWFGVLLKRLFLKQTGADLMTTDYPYKDPEA